MTIKFLTTAVAVTAGLLVMGSTARADKPLDVDCAALEATNDAVDDFLDGANIQFQNLGQLFSAAITDDAVFDLLDALINAFGGPDFDSASQAITTNAKCGLITQVIRNIRD